MKRKVWSASGLFPTSKLWSLRMFYKTQPDLSMAALVIERSRISYHEKRAAHLLAKQCHRVNLCPEKTPANLARHQLLKQHTSKLWLLFRNAHAVSTGRRTAVERNWNFLFTVVLLIACQCWNKFQWSFKSKNKRWLKWLERRKGGR